MRGELQCTAHEVKDGLLNPVWVCMYGHVCCYPVTRVYVRVFVRVFGTQGMQDSDEKTRRALLDFSFSLATGNMDEAFRCVRLDLSTRAYY